MRIGGSSPSDTSNYYEYRQTITLSQNVNWHEIDVDFQDWTGLKLDKPDTVEFIRKDNFIVKGDPSLTAIRRITVGIASKNPDGVSGEIWVDDVRVSDVNRQKGFAFYGGLSADFGGFLQFTLDASWRDAEFSTLRGRTGSRMEEFSYGINNARIKLDEFFPRSWGLNMPLSGSLRKSVKKPKFQTNSDIELPDEESYNQRTETTNKSLNFNYRKSQKSENPLIRIFVDPFSFGVKANQRTNYSPTAIDSSVEYSGNIDYNYTFGDNSVNIPLLGAFSYSPSKLTFSARYSERDQTHYTILQDGTKRQETRRPTNSLDGRADFSYSPFRTINTGYSLSVKNDRTYESDAEILGFNLGTETDRQQRVDLSYRPNLPSFLSSLRPGVSYNVSYNEQNRPLTTTIGDSIYWQTNISNNSTAQGDLTFDLKVLTSNLKSVLGVSGKGDRKRPEREREMKREDFEDGKAPPPYEDLEKEKEEEREKEEEKKKEDDGGGFNPMNLVFGTTFDLLDRIAPIKGTYRLTRSSRFRDVSGSPDFNYQLGLTDSLSTGIDGEFEERSEASDYSFGSGVRLFSNLNINADYRYNETTRWLPSTSNTTMETTWPSVSLNLNQLEQYPLIRSLVTSANLSSRYTVRDKEVQTLGEGITSETHTENWRPLVNFSSTWFRKLRIDLGANMSNTESRSFTGTGTVNQEETIGYNAKIDFSFSAKEGFSIPIWKLKEKVIRFESDVRFSLPISYDISKSQTVGQADPTRHTEKFSINPSMSYDFSQSITGGLRGDYSKTNDKKSGLETQMIRINIWMTFNF
jgi:cell surface protein SprA